MQSTNNDNKLTQQKEQFKVDWPRHDGINHQAAI
jgi:hypothetical protein